MTSDEKPNAPKTPHEHVDAIVLPTLHEFLAARNDRRRAYLACLVVYHVADYLGFAEAACVPGFPSLSTTARKGAVKKALKTVQDVTSARCSAAFSIVQGIANGTKHPDCQPLLPGREEDVPVFAYDTPGAGYDEGRYEVPGLRLWVSDDGMFLDVCAQQVLAAFVCAYPQHLGGISLHSFMDPGLEVLALPGEPRWLTGIAAWAKDTPEAAEVWLFEAGPDASMDATAEVRVGVVLTETELAAIGGLNRSFVAGEQDGRLARWRSDLAGIVGREVDLTLIAGSGEPDGTSEPAERSRGIRLWTRPSPADADPEHLPMR